MTAHALTPGSVAGAGERHRPDDTVVDPELPVTDRGAAEAYVASVCFKHGPPRLLGVELEWLVRDTQDPARRIDPAALARALGPHTPPTLRGPGAAPISLPRGGTVTVEPGGQVEIASPPADSLTTLLDDVAVDAAELGRRLAGEGLALVRRAADPLRPPRRLLDVPRYAAMEAAFDRIGPYGRTMMCSTASVQVCVDAGEGAAVADRWHALHELGPVLTAAFANSAAVHGRRTGWRSTRMASWLTLDPERTSPPARSGADPAADYARRAIDTTLLCVRPAGVGSGRARPGPSDSWSAPASITFADWIDGRGGLGRRPTGADLDYHLTTLFPPVRPQGHLEVRYLDQQSGDEWRVPVAVVSALLADPVVLDRARAAVAPTVGRWIPAARDGLADPALHRAAVAVVEIALDALDGPDGPEEVRAQVEETLGRRVARGRSPADDPVGEPGEGDLAPPGADPFVALSAGTYHHSPAHPDPYGGEPR